MNGFKTLSSYFDDTIDRLFGIPFKDIFSSTNIVSRRSYTDPEGNTVTCILSDSAGDQDERYYINGEEVESLPSHVIRRLKDLPVTSTCLQPMSPVNRLPSPLVKGSDFPAIDMYLTADGGLEIISAIAGIDPDRVELTFDNDYLKLKIVKKEEVVDEKTVVNRACLVRGIKTIDGDCYKDIFIDPNKYDVEGLDYKIQDGLLKIYIPKSKNIRSFTFKKAESSKPVEKEVETETESTEE